MAAVSKTGTKSKRDHHVEQHLALNRRAARFAGIRQQRDDGSLSQEMFQVSQALILCGLTYQPIKPEEVRAKWVEMMNGAMQKAGINQQLDPRSWAEQGRADLAELREEKTLQGFGQEARDRHAEIDTLRELRAELPAAGLGREAAIAVVEKLGERQIVAVQERERQELSRLDKLIAAARELAVEVKERTVAAAQSIADRMEQFRGRFERWKDQREERESDQKLNT